MVSIRMPKPLLEELKKLALSKHFMDLSEELRSIIREKYLQSKDPYLYEVKKLRQEIFEELKDKHLRQTRKQVVEELNKIKKKIKSEE